jgi:hypothetical protein
MRFPRILATLLLYPLLALANDHTVNVDETVDFSALKTFAIRETRSASQKHEFNNRLFLKKVAGIIRADLVRKGLKETTTDPDIFVDFSIATRDYSTVENQRGFRVPDSPGGQRGYVVEGTGPQPRLFNEATISLDFTIRAKNALVWRGTYRDEEDSVSKLARAVPADLAKLLSEYRNNKKN